MKMTRHVTLALLALAGLLTSARAQSAGKNEVPVIDAGLGTCTADVTVLDSAHNPIYKANVSTRIKYGFGGFHKLDLEVGTNIDGKARFTGLPEKVREPLQLTANYAGRVNTAVLDPSGNCHAILSIFLPNKPPDEDK